MKIDIPTGRVGIFISGGLDSALLYYLILKENKNVIPLLVFKNIEQQNHARAVISYLQELHNISVRPILLHHTDIRRAVKESLKHRGFDTVFVGVTRELEEFLVGWKPNNFKETLRIKGPFKDLDKSQIVELAVRNSAEHLFSITHSCASQSQGRCGCCNRCRERSWAFGKLGLTDPGIM